MPAEPYELLEDGRKTTLACPGGRVLGFGPGPGMAQCIAWNGIGSLFSSYRPSVAVLSLFVPHGPVWAPAPLSCSSQVWHPNHAHAEYAATGLHIAEDRYASSDSLVCRLQLSLDRRLRTAREFVLCFHGQVEQWPFFDYPAVEPAVAERAGPKPKRKERVDARHPHAVAAPVVHCAFDLSRRCITLRQPHPHPGLPLDADGQPPCTVQLVQCSLPLAAHGFALSEAELRTLWHEHGPLASLRLRLGQVGARLEGTSAEFSHRAPLYYFAVRVRLLPGQPSNLTVSSRFSVEPEPEAAHSSHPPAPTAAAVDRHLAADRRACQRYLSREVPQLECSDPALTKYWYYVWHVLRANRCTPGAHIKHAWTAPSKYMYWGPWIWDAYFHVLGEMWLADHTVAYDSIRAVLDMQFPNGFIPVCSGADYRMCFHDKVDGYTPPAGYGGYASYEPGELQSYKAVKHPFEAQVNGFIHNEKTQTPLITLAAADLLIMRGHELPGGKTAAARELLGPLWAYEQWLWHRRTDKHGRFILWHGDESGWDNATRHYPVPALPYDVQVHCLLHREALREVMLAAGESRLLNKLDKRIARTRQALSSYWQADSQWHADLSLSGKSRPQIAASGMFTLLAEPDDAKLNACLTALAAPQRFATAFPIPTLAASDQDYKPHGWGWNGPAWLQVNYFVLTGLLNAVRAGRLAAREAAWKLWERTRSLVIRDGEPHSFELYDPEMGTGMGCPDYSWQAMLLHLIIHYFAGVPVEGDSGSDSMLIVPCLPQSLDHLKLSRLPGSLCSIELTREERALRIEATLSRAKLVELNSAALGTFTVVEAVAGRQRYVLGFDQERQRWSLPATARAASRWMLVAYEGKQRQAQ